MIFLVRVGRHQFLLRNLVEHAFLSARIPVRFLGHVVILLTIIAILETALLALYLFQKRVWETMS